MRTSRLLLATVKEVPSEAEIVSHRLMLRAGMVRRLAAGLYSWLPLGQRVVTKVANIVREEMDRAGAQEIVMPAIQPAELWEESGLWRRGWGNDGEKPHQTCPPSDDRDSPCFFCRRWGGRVCQEDES